MKPCHLNFNLQTTFTPLKKYSVYRYTSWDDEDIFAKTIPQFAKYLILSTECLKSKMWDKLSNDIFFTMPQRTKNLPVKSIIVDSQTLL